MNASALTAHAQRLKAKRIVDLFADDPHRAQRLTMSVAGLTADFSKQRIDADVLSALTALADDRGIEAKRDAMLSGAAVNATEGRSALHAALRGPVGDTQARAEAEAARAQARAFVAAFEADRTLGGAKPITGVLHLGTGGSDLGPRLVLEALKPFARKDLSVAFAANIDGADITDALAGLDPAATLLIVVSKTFTTAETMANAAVARAWLEAAIGPEAAKGRLAAVSAAPDRATAWGAPADRVFGFWDWVGGRYSVWSSVGLSVELALGSAAFDGFLSGAASMDAHFANAPLAENLPILAALIALWNRAHLGAASTATAPYAHRLRLLPDWLAQLEMESNGKGVTEDGAPLAAPACGVTWGGAGTVAQHSFFQMLHQGVAVTPVDFLVVGGPGEGPAEHRRTLLANALAQARALMVGRSADETAALLRARGRSDADIARLTPHMTFPGDRPSTLYALEDLAPERLGALLAFYEHRTVTQAWLDGVNPFDQWGVELGKEMATALSPLLAAPGDDSALDPSTRQWLARLRDA